MIGCVIALDSEAEALLSQTDVEDIQSAYGKTIHFGKACLSSYAAWEK